jgi:membrane fusion protein, macrolide-specific efflux system
MAKTKRFRTRRSRITLAVVCIVVLGLVAFFVYRGVSGTAEATPTYTTGTVEKMTLTSSVSGTGNIEYPNTASVSPKVAGMVKGLSIKLGDTVKEGEVLFTLDNPQLDVDVADAQNAYDKAVLAVDTANLDLLSAKSSLASTYAKTHTALAAKQAVAAVTSANLSVQAAENAVTSAKIALQDAKDNAADRTVTAPMAGTITTLSAANGDDLQASSGGSGASPALVITDPSAYQATITLAESDISSVKLGQKAVLTFDALPDLTLSGKVTRVDTAGTNSSGVVSYTVVVTPDDMNSSVKGGMTVSVSIITDTAADVLAVPTSAVKSSTNGKYVQILQNGEPVDVTVETGMSSDSYTEITSGLTEGQEIITATSTSTSGSKTTSTTTRRGQQGVLDGGGGVIQGIGTPPAGGFAPPGQ